MIPKLPKDIYIRLIPPTTGPVAVDWTKDGVVQLVDILDDTTHQVTDRFFEANYAKIPEADRAEIALQITWAVAATLHSAFHKITGTLT